MLHQMPIHVILAIVTAMAASGDAKGLRALFLQLYGLPHYRAWKGRIAFGKLLLGERLVGCPSLTDFTAAYDASLRILTRAAPAVQLCDVPAWRRKLTRGTKSVADFQAAMAVFPEYLSGPLTDIAAAVGACTDGDVQMLLYLLDTVTQQCE
jgi:hypothetical protein